MKTFTWLVINQLTFKRLRLVGTREQALKSGAELLGCPWWKLSIQRIEEWA